MLEKIAGVAVITGLALSATGALLGHENIKLAGNLTLLIVATVAGYMFIKFYAANPVRELTGVCISKGKHSNGYNLTFKTSGSQLYSGKTGSQQGDKIKLGEKAKLKVKGSVIIELEKI